MDIGIQSIAAVGKKTYAYPGLPDGVLHLVRLWYNSFEFIYVLRTSSSELRAIPAQGARKSAPNHLAFIHTQEK